MPKRIRDRRLMVTGGKSVEEVLKELLAASVSIEARIASSNILRSGFPDILPRFSDAINTATLHWSNK